MVLVGLRSLRCVIHPCHLLGIAMSNRLQSTLLPSPRSRNTVSIGLHAPFCARLFRFRLLGDMYRFPALQPPCRAPNRVGRTFLPCLGVMVAFVAAPWLLPGK